MTVYSCSMFCSELDLLDVKLHELDSVVDYFVLSESTKTHSGHDKNLVLWENKSKFSNFWHKIIYQSIFNTPSDYNNLQEDPKRSELYNLVIRKVNSQKHRHLNLEHYGRDSFEKEALILPLHNCEDDDIILLSDLDEIVTADALKPVLDNFDPEQIYFFEHGTYYYYLNLKSDEISYGTIALTYKKFKEMSHCAMREEKQGTKIPNAGYHFTYLGNAEAVKTKVESFSHQEFNVPQVKDHIEWSIRNAIATGRDLYGRPRKFEIVDLETLPKYVQENQEKYGQYLLKP